MFKANGYFTGSKELPRDRTAMAAAFLPAFGGGGFLGLEPSIVLPPPPIKVANPLDKLTPVTEETLRNPDPKDWVTWRRTPTAEGFSPLNQITKANVGSLQMAWSWALPNGGNQTTPLVHDGVLYAFGFGDVIQALNAKTGDKLWEYARVLPEGVGPNLKKNIALYGDKVYMATSDFHLVALNAKTGELVWDVEVMDGSTVRPGPLGGPLAAKGKIILGTRHPSQQPGKTDIYVGGKIIAFDAETGEKAWTFNAIPGPGEPGGDTWNDLPVGLRSGGAVWNAGSYDPESNLVFFGPSATYETGPLRVPIRKGDKKVNSALYTNTTVALNPDTGKLVWHYQHQPNDQWDLDWAFERQIMELPVRGEMRRVVVTAGKVAIHEALDVKTGEYLWSWDLGMQNFITKIDPKTGEKTVDPERVPGDNKVRFVCPHVEGGKNWIPSAVNPETKILYVPIAETCMYMTPVPPGQRGLLTGYRTGLAPPPDSDGNYGRLQAINLATKKTVWTDRQRAPFMTGVLATQGGVVFAGSVDRQFFAFDDATGKRLWKTRLNSVPNSAPITYSVDGKQYVAIVVGGGSPHSRLFLPLVPDVSASNPVNLTSGISVFALPEAP
jgi:alcohol dehydrogenase (cytochrome c)